MPDQTCELFTFSYCIARVFIYFLAGTKWKVQVPDL